MLTPTDFPLRATALALKRGGRSLGIGVNAEPDLCVAMPIFAKFFLPMTVVTLWYFYLCLAQWADWWLPWRCTVGLPVAWLLCALTRDWCNLSAHSLSTFLHFPPLFAVLHLQFWLLVACCAGAVTILNISALFILMCKSGFFVCFVFLFFKANLRRANRTCLCMQL